MRFVSIRSYDIAFYLEVVSMQEPVSILERSFIRLSADKGNQSSGGRTR
jgi:hypothetical protein